MSSKVAAFARRAGLAAMTGIWLALTAPAGAASLSGRDVQIIAKTLKFLDPPLREGTIAVLYVQGDAASLADATAIVDLFGGGIAAAGGGTITARATSTVSFQAHGDGYGALIVAEGATIPTLPAAARRLLCITAVDTLVRSGRCVMTVHSQPRVDIIVNRAAAQAAGIGFTAAFGMLVHEI